MAFGYLWRGWVGWEIPVFRHVPQVLRLPYWPNHRGFRHYPVAALHSLALECSHQLPLQKGKDICESLFCPERVTAAAWSEAFLSRDQISTQLGSSSGTVSRASVQSTLLPVTGNYLLTACWFFSPGSTVMLATEP